MPTLNYLKVKERLSFTKRIQRTGIEIIAYTRCEKRNLKYIASLDSRYYEEYVRTNTRYDLSRPFTSN